MSVALTDWADGLPRAGLLHAPTPIERPARLSEALGVEVLVKREDLSGGAFGGNKVRKLDLLAATPAAQAADVWLAMGGVQSNWVRETAAAAARSGKQMTAFLRGAEPAGLARGNVMLDALLGADVHFLDTTDYAPLRAAMAREHDRLAGDGRLGHAFALGGAEPEGVAAWAAGGRELAGQLAEGDVTPDAVVVGAGTGSTALGLALGLAAAGCDAQVWGISASWTCSPPRPSDWPS
jgi:D-cysteine desulfhydrase